MAARVVRGGIQRVGGFILLNVAGAFGAVLLLRHLGVDDYGRYGTVTALLTIVYGVSDAGSRSRAHGSSRRVVQSPERR